MIVLFYVQTTLKHNNQSCSQGVINTNGSAIVGSGREISADKPLFCVLRLSVAHLEPDRCCIVVRLYCGRSTRRRQRP